MSLNTRKPKVGHGRAEIRAYLLKARDYYEKMTEAAAQQQPTDDGPALDDWRRVQAVRARELIRINDELARMAANE